MTENRRVFLNVVATYGRSLYGLALGLLCGRWTLILNADERRFVKERIVDRFVRRFRP